MAEGGRSRRTDPEFQRLVEMVRDGGPMTQLKIWRTTLESRRHVPLTIAVRSPDGRDVRVYAEDGSARMLLDMPPSEALRLAARITRVVRGGADER